MYSRGYNTRGYQAPGYKSTAKPVSQKELSEAQEAMKLLKMKMATQPKRPAPKPQTTGKRFVPTFDIESQMGGQPQKNYGINSITQSRPMNRKPMNQGYNFSGGYGGMTDSRPIGGGANFEDMNPGENEPTYPCPDCGRSFNQQALMKHKKICKKVFQKKRKAFDMTKQRVDNGEQRSLMKQGQLMEKRNPKLNNKKIMGGVPKWKKQSEEFRSILKANRGLSFNNIGSSSKYGSSYGNSSSYSRGGMSSKTGIRSKGGMGMGGMGMPSYTPSAISDDFPLCKFCNRRYNDEAYNKHLPGCERRYKEAQIRNKIQKKPVGKVGNKYGKKGY